MARPKFIAGNWKMHTDAAGGCRLAEEVVRGVGADTRVRVAVCPPFPYLPLVASVVRGSPVALGAQNCYPEREGAFTGEVSPWMLADVGCRWVILGHSERRHKLGEDDAFINRKVHAALEAGLEIILCLGETLQERQAGRMEEVLATQLDGGLAGLGADRLGQLVVAYEPVWAIGTGHVATPQQAQEVHAFLRGRVRARFGAAAAEGLLILYGGSVKPENVAALLHQPDVDGGLIGGASLKAESFLAIVSLAAAPPPNR
jgi:triosephosphate isomerase